MNATRRYQADCAKLLSASLNGTELPLPWIPDVASCKFWSIVYDEVLAGISAVLILIFFVFSLFINTYLLVRLEESEALSWQPRYTLLKNLIVSDLLKSLSVALSALYCFGKQQTLKFNAGCVFQYFTTSLAIITSLLIVTSMSLERFLYTCHGTRYLTIMTNARLRIYVIFVWLLALTGAGTSTVLVLTGRAEFGHVISGLVCEPEVMQAQLGNSLYFKTFNQFFTGSLLILCLLVFSFSYGRMSQVARQEQKPFQQDNVRARRTVAFYLGVFFLQLFPFTVTDLKIHLMFIVLMLVPPCVNPLAFSRRNAEVRRVLEHLWG